MQTAPAVRIALGEDLGLPHGEIVTGKMAAALRKLGFNSVLDTDFTADLTEPLHTHYVDRKEEVQRFNKPLHY
jgi:iron only hydrogenase large subunit-like protein